MTKSKQPTCDTHGCGRPIPRGGEGHPQICPRCLDAAALHEGRRAVTMREVEADRRVRVSEIRAEAAERLALSLLLSKYGAP